MLPETIEAITKAWNGVSVDRQKALIRRFLENYGTGDNGLWMEFLLDQFGLEDRTAASFLVPCAKRNRCPDGCSL